jgi:hypothetical protein
VGKIAPFFADRTPEVSLNRQHDTAIPPLIAGKLYTAIRMKSLSPPVMSDGLTKCVLVELAHYIQRYDFIIEL